MSEIQKVEKAVTEILVMFKAAQTVDDVAQFASSVAAQIVEIRTMFGNKTVVLMTVDADDCDAVLLKLNQDIRVELAQINRNYRHCQSEE